MTQFLENTSALATPPPLRLLTRVCLMEEETILNFINIFFSFFWQSLFVLNAQCLSLSLSSSVMMMILEQLMMMMMLLLHCFRQGYVMTKIRPSFNN